MDKIAVPKYGFNVKLNHDYPDKRDPYIKPSFWQIFQFVPLAFRYLWNYWELYREGRRPCMDYLHLENGKRIYGVPIGGIGSGSIGRGYRGEFCRFQLRPGKYEYNTVPADQFIVNIKDSNNETLFQSVLSTHEKPTQSLQSWEWLLDSNKCNYTGLYPRSWTEYDLSEFGIKLICRQISPVIPNDYIDSSLPCAVFVWSIYNISMEERTVSITFSFKNGTGTKKQDSQGNASSYKISTEILQAVCIKQTIDNMVCTYNISTRNNVENIGVSTCEKFDPCGNGEKFWKDLYENGCFTKRIDGSFKSKDIGVAICGQTKLGPNSMSDLEFSLCWDMPDIHFMGKNLHKRYYAKFFNGKNAGIQICEHAFLNYAKWENAIFTWQSGVLSDNDLPDWYKGALFNELYYMSDGGTIWILPKDGEFSKDDPRYTYGHFAYLEGHEYRMYNTYDVHFYASQALATLWPYLQVTLQYDFRDSIDLEIKDARKFLYDGSWGERKQKKSIPHDLGDPWEEPFSLVNTYPIHDVSEWKDLNVKFILQVYRDYKLISTNKNSNDSGNGQDGVTSKSYLVAMYDSCKRLVTKCMQWDKDGDGLIENDDSPDQTYDTWVMKGPSAYCAGLWLAALRCMVEMAQCLEKTEDVRNFSEIIGRGCESYDKKLWNGSYYRFDTSGRNETIMSDQLCGHWYLRLCGFEYEVFPETKVKTTLSTIFANNVMSFREGNIGAVNGFLPKTVDEKSESSAEDKGGADPTTIQSEEVWTGVTYALAATMMFEGMYEEAFKTAGGLYKSLFEMGMNFETPEALYAEKHYRAIGYMRPLSIWSMQAAWERRKK